MRPTPLCLALALLAGGITFLPAASATCTVNAGPCGGSCVVNVGSCYGSCYANAGSCYGGTCVINTPSVTGGNCGGHCWGDTGGDCGPSGSCNFWVGECNGFCNESVGDCEGACFLTILTCFPGQDCLVNVDGIFCYGTTLSAKVPRVQASLAPPAPVLLAP